MTQPTTDDGTKTTDPEPTFTRAQFAKELNRQVRDKVAAALAEYGDLDELKAKAAEADKQKTQLDRIEEKLAASEQRAAKAERSSLVRDVAEELGISVRLASKLEGTTKSELLADGREMIDDLGIKPRGKAGTTETNGEGTEGESEGGENAQQQEPAATTRQQPAPSARTRPRENLRGGAPRTETAPEETNPLKLVEGIPRR